MKVKTLKKGLKDFIGDAWLVKKGKSYFVVSGVNVMGSGWEVLVFHSSKTGKVTDWGEICGGRGITHDEAIRELEMMKGD